MKSTENETLYCGRVIACGWTGKSDERKRRPGKEKDFNFWTLVCPDCGNDSFYHMKPDEKPPKRWKAKNPS